MSNHYLYDLPNISAGADKALVGTVTAVPSFTGWFLFFVFGVIFLGGMVEQKRRTGIVDLPLWGIIASLATVVMMLPMTIIQGLIQIEVVGIVIAVSLVFAVWFFLSRSRGEV